MDINEYFVEGNRALSEAEIERAVYPFLGPDRTLDDVERARAALQKAYELKGLKTVFVEIPQQNVVGGRVRLAVTETTIGQVAVSGGRYTKDETVLKALPSLAAGTTPNLEAFSAELMALNGRSADRQVTPELKAGAIPGTVDVALSVEDKWPIHAGVEVSNRYSRDTTQSRVQFSLRDDDLWGLGHSVAAFYSVAPERRKDNEVLVASYGAPLSQDLRLDVTGLVSNSDVATVGSTNVLGDGQSLTAALTRTLDGPAGLYHRVTVSVAAKAFQEGVSFAGAVDHAPITYFPISVGYAGTLAGETGDLGFNTTLTFGLRGLGSNTNAFEYKRYRATGGFAYLRGGGEYTRHLGGGFDAHLAVDAQLSNEPLISNEQFSAGGAGTVRGYLQSEIIGDNGLFSTFELRSPDFSGVVGGEVAKELRLIGFLDSARVWIKSPLPEQQSTDSLMGMGFGLRAKLIEGVSGDIDVAWPLKDSGSTTAHEPRLHVRLSTDF